jgi:hypothetical protein
LQPNDDSDTDEETPSKEMGDNDSVDGIICSDEEATDHDDNSTVEDTLPTQGWKVNKPFNGVETSSKFEETIQTGSVPGDSESRVESKVMKALEKSPIKAWILLMTNSILETIVDYSNEYGKLQNGTDFYSNITRGDLFGFICILFVSSVQKGKDKILNW